MKKNMKKELNSLTLTKKTKLLTFYWQPLTFFTGLYLGLVIVTTVGSCRVSAPPHKETHLAEEGLRACLGDFGNTCNCLVKLS